MTKKVYCKDCRYFEWGSTYAGTKNKCLHPTSRTLIEIESPIQLVEQEKILSPIEKNINYNCKYYEEK